MISVVELVKVGHSGIFGGECWLSRPTLVGSITCFVREYCPWTKLTAHQATGKTSAVTAALPHQPHYHETKKKKVKK